MGSQGYTFNQLFHKVMILRTGLVSMAVCAAMSLVSCSKAAPESRTADSIVVDGWIENGEHPMVFLSTSVIATSEKQKAADLADHLIRYAKVTIEHEGVVYPMISCLSDYYYINTYFTTSDLKGEVGGEYTLRVEYDGRTAVSTTSIPEPAELDSLWSYNGPVEPYRKIRSRLKVSPDKSRFYRYYSWIRNRQSHYSPAFMGLMSESAAGDYITIDIDPGSQLPDITRSAKYYPGDIVSVKLATTTREVYEFWSRYDQNNIVTYLPFNISGVNVTGNVDGALGCWAGYGINEYTICVN